MGLVLDTSVLIDAERRGLDAKQMLEGLSVYKSYEFSISCVCLMELSHGVIRAKTMALRSIRQKILDDLKASIPSIPVSDEIAIRAGEVDGSLRQIGITIGIADAMIAATALTHGYAVAAFNLRHFKAVPGLEVVEL